jgi:ABC-type glycerol-3-phosphate transport system substrate-binding protein
MPARGSRIVALALCALIASAISARAGEPYAADPKLVEAAKKEGEVLFYTTLIVDQIVRPLIKAFRAQVPGVDVKFVRQDSAQQMVRLIN